jgi:hypothetical protein
MAAGDRVYKIGRITLDTVTGDRCRVEVLLGVVPPSGDTVFTPRMIAIDMSGGDAAVAVAAFRAAVATSLTTQEEPDERIVGATLIE